VDDGSIDRLLDETEGVNTPADPGHRQPPVSVLGAFKAPELRVPLAIVLWAMAGQQLCGECSESLVR
jgi:hypothetical protein